MLTAPLFALAFASSLTAQVTQGAAVGSNGCISAFSGTQTTIVSTSVGAENNAFAAFPKQGDVFMVFINVVSLSQPCGTHLVARPGFRLPAGVELVAPGGFNSPIAHCLMGPSNNMTAQPCSLVPTEVLPDGTLMFDHPTGLWSIPHGHVLQIQIPVRARDAQTTQVGGYVDFASFDFARAPLLPTVVTSVYFNPPTIAYPTPSVDDIGPRSAHVTGFVDPHHNAGTAVLELAPVGQPLVAVDSAFLDAALFTADVDLVVDNLEPDTDYAFRFSLVLASNGQTVVGDMQTFRTLPPPRFGYAATTSGAGRIDATIPADDDGTYREGAEVEFSAVADTGWRLSTFTLNGTAIGGDTVSVAFYDAVHVHAVFVPVVTTGSDTTGGTDPGTDDGAAGAESGGSMEDSNANDTNDDNDGTPNNATDDGRPTFSDGTNPTDTVHGDGSADAASRDVASGGCAATSAAGAPLALLALLTLRRRRA